MARTWKERQMMLSRSTPEGQRSYVAAEQAGASAWTWTDAYNFVGMAPSLYIDPNTLLTPDELLSDYKIQSIRVVTKKHASCSGAIYAQVYNGQTGGIKIRDLVPGTPDVNPSGIYSGDTQVVSFLVTDQQAIQSIIRNGLFFETDEKPATCVKGSYTASGIETAAYGATPTRIVLTHTSAAVTPTPVWPLSGRTLKSGNAYLFRWANDADGLVGCAKTVLMYKKSTETSYKGIELAGTATSYVFDTALIGTATQLDWYVICVSDTGKATASVLNSVAVEAPNLRISDLAPTGNVYKGFEFPFRWLLTHEAAADAVRSTLVQTDYRVDVRVTGAVDISKTITGTGSVNHIEVDAKDLPVGAIDWRVTLTTNTGHTFASSWVSITNVELAVSVTATRPEAGSIAPRAVANVFSWGLEIQGAAQAPGPITQESAVLRWRPGSGGAYRTIIISGAEQSTTVPAGTFTGLEEIEWYVTVTATTGTTASSDSQRVSVLDARSAPIALSPAGVYLDDTVQGVPFEWQHVISTGTASLGAEISYSANSGASYTVLTTLTGAAETWTAPAKAFENGSVYWRVRTKNSDGVWGDYSRAAVFAIRRNPDKPSITSTNDRPLLQVRWQSAEQVGYEIEIDGERSATIYGRAKTWQSDRVLSVGTHTVRVRIVNLYGDWSLWDSVTVTVTNAPGPAITLHAFERWGEVEIGWTLQAAPAALYLLRDDVLIARLDADAEGSYVDRETAGSHRYVVRAFAASGDYTDSLAVSCAPHVPYAAIGPLDVSKWQALKYSQTRDSYSRRKEADGLFVQYWDQPSPEWRCTSTGTVTHTLTYTKKRGEDLEALRDMIGQTVVYKDYRGRCAVGVFSELPEAHGAFGAAVTITIVETQRREVAYGPL